MREIGIVTRKEYRGRGYGTAAAVCAVQSILKGGKTPLWSTGADNAASRRLAEAAGFAEFADLLTLEAAPKTE